MSEVTTGTIALSLVEAPVAVGAACVVAVGYAAKYCKNQYEDMLKEIQETEERLKWLNRQQLSSPKQIAREAQKLKEIVYQNDVFNKMTDGLSVSEKNILATTIATENSPLKSYIPKYLDEMEKSKIPDIQTNLNIIDKSTRDLAVANFNYLNQIVKDAAQATGFSSNFKIIKKSVNVLDIVFTDSQGHKFTAYSKINKDLNPSLSLDLEGFGTDTNACSLKMNEIIKFLNDRGIPFKYKKLKHNSTEGLLRKILNKKYAKKKEIVNTDERNDLEKYLTQNNTENQLKNKH